MSQHASILQKANKLLGPIFCLGRCQVFAVNTPTKFFKVSYYKGIKIPRFTLSNQPVFLLILQIVVAAHVSCIW